MASRYSRLSRLERLASPSDMRASIRDASVEKSQYKILKNTEEWEAIARTSQCLPFLLEYSVIFFDFGSSFLLNFFGESVKINIPNQKLLENEFIKQKSYGHTSRDPQALE